MAWSNRCIVSNSKRLQEIIKHIQYCANYKKPLKNILLCRISQNAHVHIVLNQLENIKFEHKNVNLWILGSILIGSDTGRSLVLSHNLAKTQQKFSKLASGNITFLCGFSSLNTNLIHDHYTMYTASDVMQ